MLILRRSSKGEDRQTQSLPDQISDIKKFVEKEKLKVGIWFPGESQSAFVIGRPIFADAVKAIMDGKINALVAWHANRLARNSVDAGMIIYLMDIGKLKAVYTLSKTYYNTPSDKFFLGLDFGISKKDSDEKGEVVKRGITGKAKQGLPHGIAAVGFINDITEEKGKRKWLVDDVRLPLVEIVLKEFLKGKYSVPGICLYAKDEVGLTTMQRKKSGGKPIARSYTYTMLRNPIYAGFFFQNGVRYELASYLPRIITEEQYWQIQDKMGRKGLPRITNRKAAYDKFTQCGICGGKHCTDFKFQVICSACKKKFSHVSVKECPVCGLPIDKMENATFLEYIFYCCLNHKTHRTTCPNNGIEEKNLEKQLLFDLERTLTISKGLSAWCIENIGKLKDAELDGAINLQRNLEQEKATLEAKIKRLTLLRISRDCSAEENTEFDNVEKDLKSQLSLTELKLSNTNIDWITEAKKDFDLMAGISELVVNGTTEQKIDLLFVWRSNLSVLNKIVTVTHKKQIEAFKTCLMEAKTENPAFEPKTCTEIELNNDKTEAFASARTTLLRD